MSDCIFCKIAAGEIPSATIYEDDDFRVILDMGPATRGHALILPKKHFADVTEISGETAAKVLPLAAKIGTAMKKSLGCAGFNLVQNNGTAAGQTVFHFHVHVIPRYEDGPKIVSWNPGSSTEEERAAFSRRSERRCSMKPSASADRFAEEQKRQQEEDLLINAIYKDYGKLLKKLAINNGVELDDVEDLIQDTIVSYYLAYDLTLPENEKLALLGRILINKSRDIYRRNAHYQTVGLNTEEDEIEFLKGHFLPDSALQSVMRDEYYRAVRKCILGMRKIWRDVIILHIIEGRPEREVAKLLDISETACRARISRARKYLREALSDWFKD